MKLSLHKLVLCATCIMLPCHVQAKKVKQDKQSTTPIQDTSSAKITQTDAKIKNTPAKKNSTIAQTDQKKSTLKEVVTKDSVVVNNTLTEDMLTYKKHWSGHHHPNKFKITFNGQAVENGSSKPVKLSGSNKVEIQYEYEFAHGFHKGSNKIVYEIEPNAGQVDVSLDWSDKPHIHLKNAKLISCTST